ncbi:hypothetical protein BN1708_020041, partial [Verticillium longisporum]
RRLCPPPQALWCRRHPRRRARRRGQGVGAGNPRVS